MYNEFSIFNLKLFYSICYMKQKKKKPRRLNDNLIRITYISYEWDKMIKIINKISTNRSKNTDAKNSEYFSLYSIAFLYFI
jgi:hypothetical protein